MQYSSVLCHQFCFCCAYREAGSAMAQNRHNRISFCRACYGCRHCWRRLYLCCRGRMSELPYCRNLPVDLHFCRNMGINSGMCHTTHCKSYTTLFHCFLLILPRFMECRRGLATRILSVRPSVCPSDAWIVTKRKKNQSRFVYLTKEHLA